MSVQGHWKYVYGVKDAMVVVGSLGRRGTFLECKLGRRATVDRG